MRPSLTVSLWVFPFLFCLVRPANGTIFILQFLNLLAQNIEGKRAQNINSIYAAASENWNHTYTMWNSGLHVCVSAGVYASSLRHSSCQSPAISNFAWMSCELSSKHLQKSFVNDPTKDANSCHPSRNSFSFPGSWQHRVKVHWILSSGLRNRITAITEINKKRGEIKEERNLSDETAEWEKIKILCVHVYSCWTSTSFYLNCYPRHVCVYVREMSLLTSKKILPKERTKINKQKF